MSLLSLALPLISSVMSDSTFSASLPRALLRSISSALRENAPWFSRSGACLRVGGEGGDCSFACGRLIEPGCVVQHCRAALQGCGRTRPGKDEVGPNGLTMYTSGLVKSDAHFCPDSPALPFPARSSTTALAVKSRQRETVISGCVFISAESRVFPKETLQPHTGRDARS